MNGTVIQCALVLVGVAAAHAPVHANEYPPVDTFTRQVRAALSRGYEPEGVTYLERRRDVDISALGKVTIGPVRTFEVYPSTLPGQTYKRLIAVGDEPLSPDELARRDAEHADHVAEAARRAAHETPRARAARLREAEQERREAEAILDDAVAVFEPAFAGRDTIDGRAVLLVDIHPRPEVDAATREGRWMQHFAGRIWVDAIDHTIVRMDMRAFRDISVGWGVVGRVDEGSRVVFSRRRFEGRWLPAELTYEASGRTLLIRPFRFAVTTTYSGYKRTDAGSLPVARSPGPDRAVVVK